MNNMAFIFSLLVFSLMAVVKQGGYGPWFVALLESNNHVHQNKLYAHTYPHILAEHLNGTLQQGRKNCAWITRQVVGPFDHWTDAMTYYNLWRESAWKRGGTSLLQNYMQSLNLITWIHNPPLRERKRGGKRKRAVSLVSQESNRPQKCQQKQMGPPTMKTIYEILEKRSAL
jgi:hypothetical protein